jgi:hypothetical protein
MHGGSGKDESQERSHGKTDASGGGLFSVAHAAEVDGAAHKGNRQGKTK